MSTEKNVLVITDHFTHNDGESIYPLLAEMSQNSLCGHIAVASRGNSANKEFFLKQKSTRLHITQVGLDFSYDELGRQFVCDTYLSELNEYNVLFLRIDRPFSIEFADFLSENFSGDVVINNIRGMTATGSKRYLTNFPHLCPPIRICASVDEVMDFKRDFPVVLKPLEGYGGEGIIRIDDESVEIDGVIVDLGMYLQKLNEFFAAGSEYLAMKYMKNVRLGDKRVIVVNGKVMGAVLRTPPPNSFICNLSRGGQSNYATLDPEESAIAEELSKALLKKGVVIYGFDTLADDDGKRILSEINTLNVGGLIQAQDHSGEPIIKWASDLLWEYIRSTSTQKSSTSID